MNHTISPYRYRQTERRNRRKPSPADILTLWVLAGIGTGALTSLMFWLIGNYAIAIRPHCLPAGLFFGLVFSAVGLTHELVYAIRSKKP